MQVIKFDGSIVTTLYRKETDKNNILLAPSFHPTSLKKSLPISQFLRLRRICHTEDDFILLSVWLGTGGENYQAVKAENQ